MVCIFCCCLDLARRAAFFLSFSVVSHLVFYTTNMQLALDLHVLHIINHAVIRLFVEEKKSIHVFAKHMFPD